MVKIKYSDRSEVCNISVSFKANIRQKLIIAEEANKCKLRTAQLARLAFSEYFKKRGIDFDNGKKK